MLFVCTLKIQNWLTINKPKGLFLLVMQPSALPSVFHLEATYTSHYNASSPCTSVLRPCMNRTHSRTPLCV